MTPLTVGLGSEDDIDGVNVVDVNPRHGLWSFGLDGSGVIEFWDPRSRTSLTKLVLPRNDLLPISTLDPNSPLAQIQQTLSVTALSSHPTDGLSLAVGTSTGHTLLYDLRSPTPFAVKDQGYGEAMTTVEWLRGGGAQEDGGRVVSADSKVIKIWDKTDVSWGIHPSLPSSCTTSFRIIRSPRLHPANITITLAKYESPIPPSTLATCPPSSRSSFRSPLRRL
jgi:ribosome biogenesis protein ENP2